MDKWLTIITVMDEKDYYYDYLEIYCYNLVNGCVSLLWDTNFIFSNFTPIIWVFAWEHYRWCNFIRCSCFFLWEIMNNAYIVLFFQDR
jgi:hypothetical protein